MARGTTARFKPRTWAAVTVLSLASSLGLSLAQEGRRCWQAPNADAERTLKKDAASGFYDELFELAKQDLTKIKDGAQPSDKKIDDAILNLRAAIAYRSQSAESVRGPAGINSSYTPYFYLALALTYKDEFEAAEECLARDERWVDRIPELKKLYPRVQQQIAAGAEKGKFKKEATAWSGWVERDGSACLTSTTLQSAKQLGTNALGSADVDQARKQFKDSVIAMVQAETKRLGGKLAALDSAAAASCAAPQSGATIETAKKNLVQCCQKTTLAMRQGGQLACKELSGLKNDLDRKKTALRAYGATPPPSKASIPAPCSDGADWSGLAFAELWTRTDALDVAASRNLLQADIATLQAELTRQGKSLRQQLQDTLSKIVVADKSCVEDLSLAAANNRLASLQSLLKREVANDDLVPTDDLLGARAEIERLLPKLASSAKNSAGALAGRPDTVEGIDASKFAGLRSGLAAIQREFNQASLNELCKGARPARQEDNAYWARETPQLQKRLDDRVQALELAASYRPPDDAGSLECIDVDRAAMPGSRIRRGDQRGVQRALESIKAADNCLGVYLDRYESWAGTVTTDLAQMLESLAAFPQLPGSLGDRIARSKQGLQQAGSQLQGKGLEFGDYQDAGALRARVQEVHEPLIAADEALSEERPFVEKLGPVIAVTAAFDRYNSGDVDAAIESLRQAKAWQSESGESASPLLHATMSYFLYAKHLAFGEGGEPDSPSSLLLADARAEARIARGMKLPGFLKDRGPFVTFFETQSSSE